VTRLRDIRPGFDSRQWHNIFPLRYRVHIGYGAQPASYPTDPGALSLGVKWPGREAYHSQPSSAEVKNV